MTGPEETRSAGARQVAPSDPEAASVTHRCYVSHEHAHYGGGIAAGAYVLGLFGDVATELSVRTDGDEGLLAGYDQVRFLAPVQAGDVLEVTATLIRSGRRSRLVAFSAQVVCRSIPENGSSAAGVLTEPLVVATAQGTVVVPG